MGTGEGTGEVIWLRAEGAGVGRPAHRSRAEITAAAVGIADREGLEAVSMRRVAAELGTGAASLYRYMDTREDLLDLMTDSTAVEYRYSEPGRDWLAGLIGLGEQERAILRRHPWLLALVLTRPTLGPNGLDLLEYALEVLAPHPADVATKLEAFAILNTFTAVFVQYELAGSSASQQRNAAYLQHEVASGRHPRLAELLAQPSPSPPAPTDRYQDLLARTLTGLLGPS